MTATLRMREMSASLSPRQTAEWMRWSWGSSWRKMVVQALLPFLPSAVPVKDDGKHGDVPFDCLDPNIISHWADAAAVDIVFRVVKRRGSYDCDEASEYLLNLIKARHHGGKPACGRIAFFRDARGGHPAGWHSAVVFWSTPTQWIVVEPQTGERHFMSVAERQSVRAVYL